MPDRVILAVKFTPVSAPQSLRKSVGGFLRYVQYRDKHSDLAPDSASATAVEGMLKYVAHRDAAAGQGRMFGAKGRCGDEERHAFAAFIARAVRSSSPLWGRDRQGARFDRRRAVYRFVISPERAEGLDLSALTRAAVTQLESDLGCPLRWIAAEHRNTRHPHVHLVMAGIRDEEGGSFSGWLLSGARLARMKGALALEIERQREANRVFQPGTATDVDKPVRAAARPPEGARRGTRADVRTEPRRRLATRVLWRSPRLPRPARHRPSRLLSASRVGLHRLAARYRREMEWQAEEERRRINRESHDRG